MKQLEWIFFADIRLEKQDGGGSCKTGHSKAEEVEIEAKEVEIEEIDRVEICLLQQCPPFWMRPNLQSRVF